jgi:hypothetical protein
MKPIAVFMVCTTSIAASAASQSRPRTLPAPARIAGIAPAPPAPPPSIQPPGSSISPGTIAPPGDYPVAAGVVPVIVTADGRVYADFGWGYEQVIRQCAQTITYVAQTPATTAAGASQPAPPAYKTPTYTTPTYSTPAYSPGVTATTPARPTTGISAPSNPSAPSSLGSAACWINSSGRTLIIR